MRHGYQVTQATISRELSALGASKQGGVYRLPPPTDLPAPVLSSAVAAGGGMVVLQTIPAHASVLAQAIDAAELNGVLGTVAGDDTVFVAVAGPEGVASLKRLTGRTP